MTAPVHADSLTWHNALDEPFLLEGFPFRQPGDDLYRLPQCLMSTLPPLLQHVAAQPAGAGLRVAATGNRLAIRVQLGCNETSRNCTYAATHGVDAYVDSPLGWTFVGNLSIEKPCRRWSAEIRIPDRLAEKLGDTARQWLLHLPLQNPVARLKIGLEGTPMGPRPRRQVKPLVCYGSSITQGFCASRPGLTWTNLVARALDAELIPLGFGGSARGESAVANAIAGLDAACLVVDYDHNAPTPELLEATHLPFLGLIRSAQPHLPIVIASSPNFHGDPLWWGRRRDIISATARTLGGPCCFVDGERYFTAAEWADTTLDRCHPNDVGFRRMADLLLPAIRSAMGAAI